MIAGIPYAQFCLAHREWYENLYRYKPSEELLLTIRTIMPHDWLIKRSQVWFQVSPPQTNLPQQGWKLHITATSLNCDEVLRKTAFVCFEHQVPFKFAVDRQMVDLMSSKGWSRPSSGKFITIYPENDQQFHTLAKALDEALQGLTGPYILTDRRYGDSKVVFYRYGGIKEYTRLAVNGEHQYMLVAPDGSLEPDRRTPAWYMPDWVSDPLNTVEEEEDEEPTLKDGRYVIEEPITFSITGGVYRAHDTATGRPVVIKEARPYTGMSATGQDARDHLRKEFRILQHLQNSGVAPEPVDLFEEWEHLFLVEELIDAQDLGIYTISHPHFTRVDMRDADRQIYFDHILRIWMNIIRGVQEMHRRGIVLGDLSISNILVIRGSTDVRIIDFEAAWEQGVDAPVPLMTPGYTSATQDSAPGFEEDIYAVGALMLASLFPLNTLLAVNPAAKSMLVQRLSADLGLPVALRDLILACMSDEAMARPGLEQILDTLEGFVGATVLAPPARQPLGKAALLELVDQSARYICASADFHRYDRLFPADPNVFLTNPLSVAYGAAGVVYALHKLRGSVPPSLLTWILSQSITPEDYPPGLYFGLSGIAWSLLEIGLEGPATQIMRSAENHPLLWELPDVFYGAAGYGLACLRFYLSTKDPHWLDQAKRVGERLLEQREQHEGGQCSWADNEGQIWMGYPRGASGISLFLLYLSSAANDPRFLAVAEQGLAFEIARLHETDEGYLSTLRGVVNTPDPQRVITHYWLDGSAGIAMSLIRFWAHTGRAEYRAAFDRLAPDTFRHYTVFPGLFQGQAGLGNFQLDAYQFTGDERYLQEAHRTAETIAVFQIPRADGCAFPGSHLFRIATDFGTGSAGIALFLHRLAHIDQGIGNFNFTLDELLKPAE